MLTLHSGAGRHPAFVLAKLPTFIFDMISKYITLVMLLTPVLAQAETITVDGQVERLTEYKVNESAQCAEVNKAIDSSEAFPYSLGQGFRTPTGRQRLQFFSAPAAGCEMKGVFVVPGDELDPQVDYREYTEVIYRNYKTKMSYDGWVLTDRLKGNGNRAYFGR